MNQILKQLCVLVGLAGLGTSLWAADSPTLAFSVTRDATGSLALSPKRAITLKAGQDQPISLKCDAGKNVDCTQLTLTYAKMDGTAGVTISPGNIIKTDALWKLTSAAVVQVGRCESGELLISQKPGAAGGDVTAPIAVGVSVPPDATCPAGSSAANAAAAAGAATAAASAGAAAPANRLPEPDTETKLRTLLTTDCSSQVQDLPTVYYDERKNLATFIVTPTGDVLARPPEIIDEDDVVKVIVVAHEDLLGKLSVRRTSDMRNIGTLNIMGADATVPGAFLKAKVCGTKTFFLADFKPGKGEVTIAVQTTQGTGTATTTTGTFEFNVDTLYSGAFSLGPMYSTLKDPTFGLVSNGTGNVVTETEKGANRVLVAIIYTPFIWGRRDPEKEHLHPMLDYHRLNPMFGIVANDVSNNAIVGLSYNLSSMIYLNAGAHFGKVKRIDANSGLTVGGAFTGSGTTIPTQTQWKTGFFAGFSMDLNAAAKFFGLVTAKSQ